MGYWCVITNEVSGKPNLVYWCVITNEVSGKPNLVYRCVITNEVSGKPNLVYWCVITYEVSRAGYLMSPPCLESQGCQFDLTFPYLISCSAFGPFS